MKQAQRLLQLVLNRFRPHFVVYLAAGLGVLALATATGWRWLSWLMLVWGILLLIHYLIYKSHTVDERWVEERTEELHVKSYDRDHIQSIRSRHDREDFRSGDPGRH